MEFTRPRGTRDFLPSEMEKRRHVESLMRHTFDSFGYSEVATPTFENLELFTTKSGEEIKEHLYHFKDKGDRDLALRPELTAAVMRLYINELQVAPKPQKIFYIGNCFRYERPQSGRYREFWQVGAELIGSSRPEADAEVIALAMDTLNALKLKNCELHIGHIGILRGILEENGVKEDDQEQLMGIIDKGEEAELQAFLDDLGLSPDVQRTLNAILYLKGEKNEGVLIKAKKLLSGNPEALDALNNFRVVLDKLDAFGVEDYTINLGIARGLDYYTGTVFEIYAANLGAQKQICGGGTYSLVEVLGGKKTPTCGFAFGFDRVILALEKEGYGFEEGTKTRFFVMATGPELADDALKVARRLRGRFPAEADIMARKMGKALKYASNRGFSHAVILGEDEFKTGRLIIKDLRTGKQVEIGTNEVETFEP